jgi:NAD(P)-dependent dehydrogenase (short-subunit alcohol dehydrogenase family)
MNMDLRGKTCLITGATNGIGRVSALELAKLGARVVLLGRDPQRTEETRAEVAQRATGPEPRVLLADLASLDQVRRAARDFLASGEPLHVLLNNAGVMNSTRHESTDGFEATFAVNHLAHFLFTNLLLQRIIASAPARIVNVSSDAHQFGGALDFADLNAKKSYRGMAAYGRSKLANVLFTRELSRRLEGTRVTVNAVHPGGVRTGFGMNNEPSFLKTLFGLVRPFLRSPEQGADTLIWACSAPELEGVTGSYFADRRPRRTHRNAKDDAAAQRLWDVSAKLTGLSA